MSQLNQHEEDQARINTMKAVAQAQFVQEQNDLLANVQVKKSTQSKPEKKTSLW